MAQKTEIQWCNHTFNPWSGCQKVSPVRANCYAEVDYSVRIRGVKWGPQGNRIVKAESGWKEPLKWDRDAASGKCPGCNGKVKIESDFDMDKSEMVNIEKICVRCDGSRKIAPYRARVFCASLADIFEDWQGAMLDANQKRLFVPRDEKAQGEWIAETPQGSFAGCRPLTMNDVRKRLFALIDATPSLDWLLLTKRPENISRMFNEISHGNGEVWSLRDHMPNVWLGTSIENQKAADERISILLRTPATVRFLSCEPLLGPIDLPLCFHSDDPNQHDHSQCAPIPDWVIVGGESGANARPCQLDWIRSIVSQCKAAGVKVHVKQIGSNIVMRNDMVNDWLEECDVKIEHHINGFREDYMGADCRVRLRDQKGGNMAEWPADVRIRQYPEPK